MKVVARPSFDQLVSALDRHHAELCTASAALLQTIAYLDQTESWGGDETSLECFLSARFGVTSGTAFEWVRVARTLRVLPAIREAYEAGHLSWDQVRPLTRFATPETDERLALDAPAMRVGQLWRDARRLERERKQREPESDRQMRYLRMEWDEDKRFLHLEGDLPAEQGAAVEAAIERRAEDVVVEDDVLYDRKGARLADALTELVTSSRDDSERATLGVHADAAVVAGLPATRSALAETESGVQLSDEAVRRLACDARIEWVLEDAGRAVGIGRRGRTVPGWLLRQLRFRDPECRFDGCSRRSGLVVHHIVPWARGGPTDLDNLVRLCPRHHRLVHECRWVISGHPERRLRFHDPGSRRASTGMYVQRLPPRSSGACRARHGASA